MGMSIDEAIEFFNGLECYTPQAKDARDIAIDTMRKYQKIEQVIRDYEKLCDSLCMQKLDGSAYTKKIDEFYIDTMRGLLVDYYAERIGYGTK